MDANGIPIDPSGNIIYAVPFPKIDSWDLSKSLSIKPKLSANVGGNFQIINLSKEGDVFIVILKNLREREPPNDGSGFLVLHKYTGNLSFGRGYPKPSKPFLLSGPEFLSTSRRGPLTQLSATSNAMKKLQKLPLFKKVPTTFKELQK